MAFRMLRVLEREPRFMRRAGYVRGGLRVAPLLREAMAAQGLTAKELAQRTLGWASQDTEHRKPLDYRTIQHAMEGSCELDTFLTLAGYFGWDFVEDVHTPGIGADPITARENALAQMVATANAIRGRLERDRAARSGVAARAGHEAGGEAVQGLRTRGEQRAFDQPA